MTQIDIKRAVSEGRVCFLEYYRDGKLWYVTEFGELFPVPISDVGNATLHQTEKALLLMRYMRKWNSSLKEEHEATLAAIGGDIDLAGGPNDE
jgi:hypothetical protein